MTDAWRQLHALRYGFLREWDFRPDLYVAADAGGRHINLNYERHNVCTVREYIEILTAACEYVEGLNPEWSRQGGCWAVKREGTHHWRCIRSAGHEGWHQRDVDGEVMEWPSPCLTPITQEKDDE